MSELQRKLLKWQPAISAESLWLEYLLGDHKQALDYPNEVVGHYRVSLIAAVRSLLSP